MNSRSKELKKMLAKRRLSHKFRTGSKELSHEWFKAKVHKKKLPEISKSERKDTEYRRMTQEEFEKKYF